MHLEHSTETRRPDVNVQLVCCPGPAPCDFFRRAPGGWELGPHRLLPEQRLEQAAED